MRAILVATALLSGGSLAQEPKTDGLSALLQERTEKLSSIDIDDEEAVSRFMGDTLLECAALFEMMSMANSRSRPDTAKFMHEVANLYQLAGQINLAPIGEPIGSVSSYAESYMELHMERLQSFSTEELQYESESCAEFQDSARSIVDKLDIPQEEAAQ